jgi:formiminotetrahydrofolate cyclodeaminase
MSFTTAREAFETAQQIAEASNNSALEHIAAGLVDLSRAIQQELRNIKSDIEQTKSRVNSLR